VPDVFNRNKRSEVMAAVRSTGNKRTEGKLVEILRKYGVSGWRRHLALHGKPDFTFRTERLVIFVDGCFWHGCPKHLRTPKSNRHYWQSKIAGNRRRDLSVRQALQQSGWRVLRIWEHELRREQRLVQRIRRALAVKDRF
jgi:DNA mismatch endonuclease (patch repair protein)